MEIKPTLCIYHGPGCADGFGAAWAVWKAYPDCKFVARNYGEKPPDVTGEDVVIVDFSFPLFEMQLMASVANSLTILDHHKTALGALTDFLEEGAEGNEGAPIVKGVFDMLHSGAWLAWTWFHPGPVPKLIRYLQDYDLWKHELPNSREINAAISSYDHNFEDWSRLATQLTNPDHFVVYTFLGDGLRRKHEQTVKLLSRHARFMTIGGFRVPVVNANKIFSSDLGHLLATESCIQVYSTDESGIGHEDLIPPPFGATYFDEAEHREFSLRSSDAQEDVSVIAKSYGGGGHRNAAGFKVPLGWEGDSPIASDKRFTHFTR